MCIRDSYGFGADGRPLPLVDTVDKLQGQERDVVVVSYGVTGREVETEAEVDALLTELRSRLMEHVRAGVRVRVV